MNLLSVPGLAFSGKAGVGKTALAAEVCLLLRRMGMNPISMGFADSLKWEVYKKYGLFKSSHGGRAALLAHGMARRQEDRDYWVKSLSSKLDSLSSLSFPVVHDVRFSNELDMLKERGFYVVRVLASVADRRRALSASDRSDWMLCSDHPSETELKFFDRRYDRVVVNSHSRPLTALAMCILAELYMPAAKREATEVASQGA